MNNSSKIIILFDGICNLCNHSIDFIIRRDKQNRFHFASLQSKKGQEILKYHQLPTKDFESFVVVHKNKVYTKSNAALQVVLHLQGGWPLLYVFIIIPPFFRNLVYSFIAKNRYRFFGKKNTCRLPTSEERSKFLA